MSDRREREESTLSERSRERRERLVGNRASTFAEAEEWDLAFWQGCSPQERLTAFVAIRRDVELVEAARSASPPKKPD